LPPAHVRGPREQALRCGGPAKSREGSSPVKKILLLVVVIALGAVIANKLRSA